MLNKLNELRNAREEGFTLIELLVVIVIIGVLAAIALPIFLNQQKAAGQAGVKSDARSLQTAVATYWIKHPTEQGVKYRNSVSTPSSASDTTTAALAEIKVNPSDANTVVKLTSNDPDTAPGSFLSTANWDNWRVVASNSSFGNGGSYSYAWSNLTGKWTETNA